MSHNTKAWPAGLTNNVSTLAEADLEHLDANAFASINGDEGSTHAPASAIVIGGAGIGMTLAAGKNMNFRADPGGVRSFDRVLLASPAFLVGGSLVDVGAVQGFGWGPCFRRVLDNVPHGATITNVSIGVRITNAHASLPATRPKLSIYRVTAETGAMDYLRADDTGLGVELADPGTVGAYNALGAIQITYTPDQNNVKDEEHTFIAFVTDEEGGGAIMGNLFYGFKVTFTLTEFATH